MLACLSKNITTNLKWFVCLSVLIADIFGISDHNLMYTQEAVEAPEEISNTVTDEAIEARVRILCI